MKLFRKLTTMLCVFALLLSLAPAAFAAEDGGEEETVIEYDELEKDVPITGKVGGKKTEYVHDGNLHVNEGVSITITTPSKGAVDSEIKVQGVLNNDGTVSAEAKANKDYQNNEAEVHADGDVINNGLIKATGQQGSAGFVADASVTSGGNIYNQTVYNEETLEPEKVGTITVTGDDATVSAAGVLVNDGSITVTADNKATVEAAQVVNYNEITVAGADAEIKGDVENYGIITLDKNGLKGVYYGVTYGYENDDGFVWESALKDWTDGSASDAAEITFETSAGTKAGYSFGGWKFSDSDTVYEAGKTYTYTLDSAKVIEAIWNKILEMTESHAGPEKTEKSAEKIVKYIEAKVLDAERREMEMETEYFKVAKTSYGRLIVVFTPEQMAAMEQGAHLFYIVQPDGTETEYTLNIW